jgi:hypothetical protein
MMPREETERGSRSGFVSKEKLFNKLANREMDVN